MANSSTKFGDKEYNILAEISDLRNTTYLHREDLRLYIVQAADSGQIYTARLARSSTALYKQFKVHLEQLAELDLRGPHPLILVPLFTFNYSQNGNEYIGAVYDELLGLDVYSETNSFTEHRHPEITQHVGRCALRALEAVHSSRAVAGITQSGLIMTYANVKRDVDSILKFYGYDGTQSQMNESHTGPRDTPLNIDALVFKLDLLDSSRAYRNGLVPEVAFGETAGTASDMCALGNILYDLAAETIEEVNGLIDVAPLKIRSLVTSYASRERAHTLITTKFLGPLPGRFQEQLSEDERFAANEIEYDGSLLATAIRNGIDQHDDTPDEERMTDKDIASLVDLLRSLLAIDPLQRPTATEALKHAYFERSRNRD